MKDRIIWEYTKGDIRAFLLHFEETHEFACDMKYSEYDLCKIALVLLQQD